MHAILAARSDMSIGESILTVERLVKETKAAGAKAVALTDTMSVTSLADFTKQAKKEGLKPIIGTRLRLVDDPTWRKPKKGEAKQKMPREYYVTLYALSEAGLKAIFRLLTLANSEERFYFTSKLGFTDLYDALAQVGADDLALTTGDSWGLLHHPDALNIVRTIAALIPRVYCQITPVNTPLYDTLNMKACDIADELQLPTLALRPALYGPGEADPHEVMLAITKGDALTSVFARSPYPRDLSPVSDKQMVEELKGLNSRLIAQRGYTKAGPKIVNAIKNTDLLVDSVKFEWAKWPVSLPVMAPDEFAAVMAICKTGWKKRFGQHTFGHCPTRQELEDVYRPRLAYELRVLKALNFSGYFLLVEDVVRYAKDHGILVGPGRGCFVPGSQVVMNGGSKRKIETIKVGDEVIAHDGSIRPVIDTLTYDCDEEILELEFENGQIIRCTKDHEFHTKNRGWIRAEEISSDDEFDDVEGLIKRT